MYKIMIHIDTHTNDTWFYYQEEGKDYVANSLEEIRETVLTLIDVYGEDYIKIVKQETGDDMLGSVETFLYDSTDNYEELMNRPFINGVEIIGSLSLAELGIQPAGNYATNERVDVLEEMVNNIDLNPYATNARVDQVEAKVDAIDLEPYATMDYLDEVVAGIDFSASNENITGVKTFSVLPRSTVMPVTEDELTNKSYVDHEVLGCATEEYVNELIQSKEIPVFEVPAMGAVQSTATMEQEEAVRFIQYCNEHYGERIYVYINCGTEIFSGIYSGIPQKNMHGNGIFKLLSNATTYRSGVLFGAHLYVSTAVVEGEDLFDINNVTSPHIQASSLVNLSANYAQKSKVLLTDGTTAYTPTSDYHPATKQYVDNAIGGIEIPEADSKLNVPWVEMAGGRWVTASETGYDYDWHPTTTAPSNVEYFKKAIANTKYGSTILFKGYIGGFNEALFYSKYPLQTNWSSYVMHGFELTQSGALYYYTLTIGVTWEDQVPTFSSVSNVKRYNCTGVKVANVLTKANTTEFIPTGDYNPATKKYVDDAVANIGIPEVDSTDGRRIYNVEFYQSGGSDILGPDTLNQIGEMITNWYKTSERSMLMFASFWSGNNDGIRYAYIYQGLYTWNTGSYYDRTTGLNYQNSVFQFNKLSDNAGKVFDSVSLRIEGSWDNDVYTCTKCAFTVGTDLAAEIKTIKQNYAKIEDVTTMINSAINSALEGEY